MRAQFRLIGGLLGFSLISASAAVAQELKSDLLAKVKAATVFIKSARGSGSGFLFRKSGGTGFVITCEHVARGSDQVEVVFSSGSKTAERSIAGKVGAEDPDRDLACLILKNAKDLPTPLELGTKTEVKETEAVYAAGFPFGEMLSASSRNPEISLAKVTVSSIRKGDFDEVVAVQLSGDINPGNSGGPVIDSRGRVVGVAQSKIMLSSTAFAVPTESLQGFLRGRVKSIGFSQPSSTETAAKVEVVADIVDPLGTLKSVGIAFMRLDAVKEEMKADKDGKWRKASPAMKDVFLKINEEAGSASATFDASRAAGEPATVSLYFQTFYTQADGSTHWTQPGTQNVSFGAGGAVSSAPSPIAGGGKNEVQPEKPPPKGSDLKTADSLEEIVRLPLRAVIADLFLTKDGATLYALDLSESKVYKINAADLKVQLEVEVADNAVAMAMAGNESVLYVAARSPAGVSAGAYSRELKGGGIIQVIGARDLKVTSSFQIDPAPVDIAATNAGTVAVSVAGQWDGLVFVDVSRKAVTGASHLVYGEAFLHMHPDQTRVYSGDVGLSPADYRCTLLQKDPKMGHLCYDSSYHGDYPLGGDFDITPDGRFLVGAPGTVLRLAKAQKQDLQYVAKIEPFLAVALAPGCNTFFTATSGGFVKEYGMDNFELRKSIRVDKVCGRLALDPKRKVLYAAAAALPPANDPSAANYAGRGGRRPLSVSDIVAWSLGGAAGK